MGEINRAPNIFIYFTLQAFVLIMAIAFLNDRSWIHQDLNQIDRSVQSVDQQYHKTNARLLALERQNGTVIAALGFLGNSELLNAMEENLACALVRIETQTIIASTPQANAMFGYKDLSGSVVNDLVPASLRSSHINNIQKFMKSPSRIQMANRKLRGLKKDGTEFDLTIWLLPRRDRRYVLCVFL